ncbi:MAG: GNAT family N-acetyltransferase, partial [Acidaminococcaceae bacterium]|nr:GNAT family N-acetyltransferase [Acidaminococcaceae bacterium]
MGQTASESVEENIFKVIESGKTDGLSFRLCEEKDLPTVMEIDGESFFDPWSLAAWRRELENPIALWIVEEVGGHIVGYAGIWNVAGEAQVMRVAVKKSLRNRGLGLV